MGIFGISRENVGDIKKKRIKTALKRKRGERELKEKTEKAKAETAYYKVRAERKEAKERAAHRLPALPTFRVKVKKKKQGRKLSSKSRIRLI